MNVRCPPWPAVAPGRGGHRGTRSEADLRLRLSRTLHHAAMGICFFGNSFVNGMGDGGCLGWPGRLCAEVRQHGHAVALHNLGIRRDTSDDVVHRWKREASARLRSEHDGRLVFPFGVNDCVHEQEWPRVGDHS